MFGLTEDAMLRMLNKNVHQHSQSEVDMGFIRNYLIPNIVEVIAANNEALLFHLEKDRTSDDSGKTY